jgi:RNA-binding protein
MRLEISKNKRLDLKRRAHSLEPVVILGNKGLTQAVIDEIEVALKAHELIKIKLRGMEKEERKEAIDVITDQLGAAYVADIGFVATIYRPKPVE